MKKIIILFSATVLSISLTSCATVFTGTSDRITFNSTPEGAKVLDRGIEKCTTPCSQKFSRSLNEKTIEIKKEGYQSKMIELDTKFNAVSVLNFFNLLFWGVDAATGSIKKYDTKVYNVELEPKKL